MENVENSMDSKKNYQGSVVDVRHKKRAANSYYERELGLLGHVLRRDGLESTCPLGMIERKRALGRQRLTYIGGIKETADIKRIGEFTKLARGRKKWKSIVSNVN